MTSSTGAEFHGKTVEEAIQAGLAALGLKQNQVTIEVLSKGSRGLLGFGAEDARVRITPLATPTPPPPPPPAASAPPPTTPAPAAAAPAPQPPAAPRSPADAEAIEAAVELLQGMLDRMGVRATVRVVERTGAGEEGDEAPIVLNIEGEDLGVLIGRRSETLGAIQYLLRLMVNHRLRRWVNVEVDVQGYKARREDQLRKLAVRMAEKAVSSGRAVTLEAMPARERRIVHIALRNYPGVTTQSFGEGEHRKVTIIPVK
ncbi:MAG: protein jag [Caldilineales bacterium]|nr:protein jag [Caldilineales bacterium]MDW8317968.1 RNA-binding cell elongation regulator Jag/EloR [Anaerolineae bacterium]